MAQEIMPVRHFNHRPIDLQVDAAILGALSSVSDSGDHAKVEAVTNDAITTINLQLVRLDDPKESNYIKLSEPHSVCLQYNTPLETGTHILLEGYEFHTEAGQWSVYERILCGRQKIPELHKGYLGQHHVKELNRALSGIEHLYTEQALEQEGVVSRTVDLFRRLRVLPELISAEVLHTPTGLVRTEQPFSSAETPTDEYDTGPSDDVSNTLLQIIDKNEMSYAQAVVFYRQHGERCEVYKNTEGAVISVRCEFKPTDGVSVNVQRIVELTLVGDVFQCTEILQAIDSSSARSQRSNPEVLSFTTACDILTIAHNSNAIDELSP